LRKAAEPVDCLACRWWRNLASGQGAICPVRPNFNLLSPDRRPCPIFAPALRGEVIDRTTNAVDGFTEIEEARAYVRAHRSRAA
jgi:hypothetical protein